MYTCVDVHVVILGTNLVKEQEVNQQTIRGLGILYAQLKEACKEKNSFPLVTGNVWVDKDQHRSCVGLQTWQLMHTHGKFSQLGPCTIGKRV